MDVRQKQLLSYGGSSEPVACPLPVFAHVISIVGLFSVNSQQISLKAIIMSEDLKQE